MDIHSHEFLHPYNEALWNDQVLKEDRRGQIRPGLLADIIAVERNPADDPGARRKVGFVIKVGSICKK
jgi:imidazolonepropionase-like amidohydrolase